MSECECHSKKRVRARRLPTNLHARCVGWDAVHIQRAVYFWQYALSLPVRWTSRIGLGKVVGLYQWRPPSQQRPSLPALHWPPTRSSKWRLVGAALVGRSGPLVLRLIRTVVSMARTASMPRMRPKRAKRSQSPPPQLKISRQRSMLPSLRSLLSHRHQERHRQTKRRAQSRTGRVARILSPRRRVGQKRLAGNFRPDRAARVKALPVLPRSQRLTQPARRHGWHQGCLVGRARRLEPRWQVGRRLPHHALLSRHRGRRRRRRKFPRPAGRRRLGWGPRRRRQGLCHRRRQGLCASLPATRALRLPV